MFFRIHQPKFIDYIYHEYRNIGFPATRNLIKYPLVKNKDRQIEIIITNNRFSDFRMAKNLKQDKKEINNKYVKRLETKFKMQVLYHAKMTSRKISMVN